MHHQDGQRAQQLQGEIPVRNTVHAVEADAVKAEFSCLQVAVGVIGRPRQGAAADRRDIDPAPAVLQAVEITQQHHRISHHIVAEAHRLGPLQMRIARHDGFGVLFRKIGEHMEKIADESGDFVTLISQIHSQVQRHLVVPAAGSVEFFSCVSDPLGQHLFDKHVDVLRTFVDCELPALQILQDSGKSFCQRFAVRFGDNPFCREHRRMGDAPGNILAGHPAVKADR